MSVSQAIRRVRAGAGFKDAPRIVHQQTIRRGLMRNRNWSKPAAGLFAASLAVAMAPMPGASVPAHFVTSDGVEMTVDPPAPNRQPLFVALPLDAQAKAAPAQPGQKK
jgi:hypothetical protein